MWGEPARVLLSGCPRVEGADLQEKRKYFMSELDQVRRVLLTEPRGYPCQNLNIILPPSDSRAQAGYIIAEQQEIYPLFSGHNTICVVTALLETGQVAMTEPVSRFNLESPGGLISVEARQSGAHTEASSLMSYRQGSMQGKGSLLVFCCVVMAVPACLVSTNQSTAF